MNLGPLEESLHLTLCLTLSHSSHEPTYVPEHSFEKGETHQHRINKIGIGNLPTCYAIRHHAIT
jgi:hypothetical protein